MRDLLGRTIAKANLPSKMCVVCERPFTWRKKWERTWSERETCSTRCLGEARVQRRAAAAGGGAGEGAGAAGAAGAGGGQRHER